MKTAKNRAAVKKKGTTMPPIPESGKRGGRPYRYPWTLWLRDNGFIAVRGRDFGCRTDSFTQAVRQQASKRGLSVRVEVSDDQQTVTVWVRR